MVRSWSVVLLVACAWAFLFNSNGFSAVASPVANDDKSLLVQVSGDISEHDAAVLESLKGVLEPLMKSISGRSLLVTKLEDVETTPLINQLKAVNRTIEDLKKHIDETNARIDSIPARRKGLERMRDGNNGSSSIIAKQLDDTISTGEQQLNSLQSIISQSSSDKKILEKLLAWLDEAAKTWAGNESLNKLQSLASEGTNSEEMKKLISFIQTRDAFGTTPSEIRDFVDQILRDILKTEKENQQTYTNLTLAVNKQRTVLEAKLGDVRKSLEIAVTQLDSLAAENNNLLAKLGTFESSLKEVTESKGILEKNLADSENVWEFERKQLSEMSTSISAVYASMGEIV